MKQEDKDAWKWSIILWAVMVAVIFLIEWSGR